MGKYSPVCETSPINNNFHNHLLILCIEMVKPNMNIHRLGSLKKKQKQTKYLYKVYGHHMQLERFQSTLSLCDSPAYWKTINTIHPEDFASFGVLMVVGSAL